MRRHHGAKLLLREIAGVGMLRSAVLLCWCCCFSTALRMAPSASLQASLHARSGPPARMLAKKKGGGGKKGGKGGKPNPNPHPHPHPRPRPRPFILTLTLILTLSRQGR